MKNSISLWKKIRSDSGMLVVEATFVYPIMFFVIIFLIYIGNFFYQKARIDNVVQLEAIRCAAQYADPVQKAITENDNKIPSSGSIDQSIQPYRYVLGKRHQYDSDSIVRIKDALGDSGFFIGMKPSNISVESRFNNYILYQTYEVTATYDISFPIKFIFSDVKLTLSFSSHAEVAATDPTEVIRNTDMVIDYAMRSEKVVQFTTQLKDMMSKAAEFVKDPVGVITHNKSK